MALTLKDDLDEYSMEIFYPLVKFTECFKNQLNKASRADDDDRLGKIRSNKNNSLCSPD